jgi:N-acetylneuraminic acid mutarotase
MKSFYCYCTCIFVVLVTLLTNCKKDEKSTPIATTKIVTKAVIVYPDGGITMTGEIKSLSTQLTEYGFLLSIDSVFTFPSIYKVVAAAATGTFTFDEPTGLQKGTSYFVAAYSKDSKNQITRYNVVSFNSSGSKRPIVSSIEPLKADLGDTLTIKGKHFEHQFLEFHFGDAKSSIIVKNDSLIKCIVPIWLTEATPEIGLWYNGTIDSLAKFSLNTPVISSFTSLATFRDTITITGDHFGYLNSLNQVSIGNAAATVVSSTRKQLKVLVPDNVPHSFNDVSLKAQVQTVATPTQFQIRPPVITSVTASGNIADPVTVKGEYFHPVPYNNVIYSENNLTQITSGNTTQLSYNIPNGAYPRRKAKVTLRLLDYNVTYNIEMVIKNKWAIVGTVPFNPAGTAGSFTINNSSYVIAPTKDWKDTQFYLWKFNPADYSWQQFDIPFKVDNAQVAATGSKAYLYVMSPNHSFYEFDPSSNAWTRKADYPAAVRYSGTIFTIGANAYLGLGTSSKTMGNENKDNSFYEYASSTNTWRRIADYPDNPEYGMRSRASAFVINNIAYVGCGASYTGMYNYYSYSPGSNAWTKIHDFPDSRASATAFCFGNKGFIANGNPLSGTSTKDCFKYDPTSDTWLKLNDSIGCESCGDGGAVVGFAFVNNGNVYVGGNNYYYWLYQTAASGL